MASVAVLDRIAAVRPVPDAAAPFFDSDDKGACSGTAEVADTLAVTLLDEQQAIRSTMVEVDAFTHGIPVQRRGWVELFGLFALV